MNEPKLIDDMFSSDNADATWKDSRREEWQDEWRALNSDIYWQVLSSMSSSSDSAVAGPSSMGSSSSRPTFGLVRTRLRLGLGGALLSVLVFRVRFGGIDSRVEYCCY